MLRCGIAKYPLPSVRCRDVEDKAAEFKIGRIIAAIIRQRCPDHILFQERFDGALEIMRHHLYRATFWNDGVIMDSVITEIDANGRQIALGQLQVTMVGLKIYRTMPDDLQKEFKSGDKDPEIAQILSYFYGQHYQDAPFGKVPSGNVESSSQLPNETNWNGAKAIFQLGNNFDFSKEPEERWKEFETALCKPDLERGECFWRVEDFVPKDADMSPLDANPEDYSNYTDYFNALTKAARRY